MDRILVFISAKVNGKNFVHYDYHYNTQEVDNWVAGLDIQGETGEFIGFRRYEYNRTLTRYYLHLPPCDDVPNNSHVVCPYCDGLIEIPEYTLFTNQSLWCCHCNKDLEVKIC